MPDYKAVLRGVCAGAIGTLAMDTVLYRRYRAGGGQSPFRAWESAKGVDSWETAPAPALVAKLLVEQAIEGEVPARYARLLTNIMHWGFGLFNGAVYGLVVGSRPSTPRRGASFGSAVWVGGYLVLPRLGIYQQIWKYDFETLEKDLSAHLVFGTATAAAFSLLENSKERSTQ